MYFTDIEFGFQEAFLSAWKAYKHGNIPIGCAVVNSDNKLAATGENSIYAANDNEILCNHRLAHAELNAILKIDGSIHPDLSDYVLYTTLEPCPLCFGAILQGNIRHVKFAAADKFDGASCLNASPIEYIKSQQIEFAGPDSTLQALQIALIVYRRMKYSFSHNNNFFEMYNSYCPIGVKTGSELFHNNIFRDMDLNNENPIEVFNYILQNYLF